MELPQPRPYGSQGRKSTHDFLSLYPPVQQDPTSSPGGFLKTHDFLQQGERVGSEDLSKDENRATQPTEKSRPLVHPSTTSSMEHNLQRGIGMHSLSHISYLNQRVPKPEGVLPNAAVPQAQASSSDRNDGNSNCSSYTGSGFTLWDESGTMNKENNFAAKEIHALREAGVHVGGQWETSRERPSQSSSSRSFHNKAFSSLSSSQQSFSKKQSFLDMIKSANRSHEDEDEDDDVFVMKKEPSSQHKGKMIIKVHGKDTDQKPNTARSKHSATEQRRRSRINDRFNMLRGLIPHGDQKRDKASFLLEVIEYIQFLQEKVHKYEDPSQRWAHEPPKIMPWKKGHRTVEEFGDQSDGTNCASGPASVFAAKFNGANTNVSSTMPVGAQGLLDHDTSTADTSMEMDHHGPTENGLPSSLPLQQIMYSHEGSSSAAVLLPPRVTSNAEIGTSQSLPQLWQRKPCTTDSTTVREKLKNQEVTIESGTISISSVYSQGLLNTLTQSLESSGVDLSRARISIQIDIGNRANSALNRLTPIVQTDDLPSNNQTMLQPRLPYGGGESEQASKRLKTSRR